MEQPVAVTCRSTPDRIQRYTRQLDDRHHKMFQESCFGHFLHLPSISFCPNVIHSVLMRRKDAPKEDAMSFMVGNQEICFGEREFAMMSGLKFHGSDKIDVPKKIPPLMETYFPGKRSVMLKELIVKFYEMENSEDRLKLCLLCIAEVVIMGCKPNKTVKKDLLHLVNNLEEFNNYPWGKLSYKATIHSLIKGSEKKDTSNAKRKVFYDLFGFPHVFQAWVFHSIPSLKANYAFENKDCPEALHPRILHLKVPKNDEPVLEQIRKVQRELSRVDIKVLSPLNPTPQELKECYMAGFVSEGEASGEKRQKTSRGFLHC